MIGVVILLALAALCWMLGRAWTEDTKNQSDDDWRWSAR